MKKVFCDICKKETTCNNDYKGPETELSSHELYTLRLNYLCLRVCPTRRSADSELGLCFFDDADICKNCLKKELQKFADSIDEK